MIMIDMFFVNKSISIESNRNLYSYISIHNILLLLMC